VQRNSLGMLIVFVVLRLSGFVELYGLMQEWLVDAPLPSSRVCLAPDEKRKSRSANGQGESVAYFPA